MFLQTVEERYELRRLGHGIFARGVKRYRDRKHCNQNRDQLSSTEFVPRQSVSLCV
jgi:hypothetical protein